MSPIPEVNSPQGCAARFNCATAVPNPWRNDAQHQKGVSHPKECIVKSCRLLTPDLWRWRTGVLAGVMSLGSRRLVVPYATARGTEPIAIWGRSGAPFFCSGRLAGKLQPIRIGTAPIGIAFRTNLAKRSQSPENGNNPQAISVLKGETTAKSEIPVAFFEMWRNLGINEA